MNSVNSANADVTESRREGGSGCVWGLGVPRWGRLACGAVEQHGVLVRPLHECNSRVSGIRGREGQCGQAALCRLRGDVGGASCTPSVRSLPAGPGGTGLVLVLGGTLGCGRAGWCVGLGRRSKVTITPWSPLHSLGGDSGC